MKVKATCNLGLNDYPFHALEQGVEAEVPDDVAAKMIKRRHAVAVEESEAAVHLATSLPEPGPVANYEVTAGKKRKSKDDDAQ